MNHDIIGDIHGHADQLEALLAHLGYRHRNGAWRPDRLLGRSWLERASRAPDATYRLKSALTLAKHRPTKLSSVINRGVRWRVFTRRSE